MAGDALLAIQFQWHTGHTAPPSGDEGCWKAGVLGKRGPWSPHWRLPWWLSAVTAGVWLVPSDRWAAEALGTDVTDGTRSQGGGNDRC